MVATGRGPHYSPELIEGGFAIEVADAPLLHEGLNLADLAHVVVLSEHHLIPPDAAARLCRVLLDAQATAVEEFGYDPVHGETYNCRERRFTAMIGKDAGWLHAGPVSTTFGAAAAARRGLMRILSKSGEFRSMIDAPSAQTPLRSRLTPIPASVWSTTRAAQRVGPA